MQICINCKSKETSRWYAGPTCNKCYCKKRRTPHFVQKQKEYDALPERRVAAKEHQKNWYRKNREKRLAKQSSEEGKQYMREYMRVYAQQDWVKEYRRNFQKNHRSTEEYRQHNNARVRRNYQKNPGKFKAQTALRRSRVLQATPKWIDLKEIERIYRDCPIGLEVDHIIPLKSDIVCGLHVPWNLQYLPKSENAKKKNKLVL